MFLKMWDRVQNRAEGERGFTLIELVAAMSVFALAAGAVLSVIVSGIRTAGFSRDRTLGKDLGRQQMEDMRRLPFYLSWATYQRNVDLLDSFYPNSNVVTGDVPGYHVEDPADPYYRVDVNQVSGFPRYRMQIFSRFRDENLRTLTPASGYTNNSSTLDKPPSRLLDVEVFVFWTTSGRQNRFAIRSQIGEAASGDITVQGSVSQSVLQVKTAFSDAATLDAEAGIGTSSVFEGSNTIARNESRAARGRIVSADGTIRELVGISQLAAAPADIGPIAAKTSADEDLFHPLLVMTPTTCAGCVMRVGPTTVNLVEAKVSAIPPFAKGRIAIRDNSADATVGVSITNEVEGGYNYLDASRNFFRMVKEPGTKPVQMVNTCTTGVSPFKTVACEGTSDTDGIELVPVDYSTLTGLSVSPSKPTFFLDGKDVARGYLFHFKFTKLRVMARAAAPLGGGTAQALAEFEGQLIYFTYKPSAWERKTVDIKSGQVNNLPALSTCIVSDSVGSCLVPLSTYIQGWDANPTLVATTSNGGRNASASLDGVVSLTTTQTNSLYPNSGFIMNIGSMKAEAVDNR